jgi:Malectin-like domain
VAPNSVLQTALTPIISANLDVIFYDTASNYDNFQYYKVKVFSVELQKLSINQSRQFNMSVNFDLMFPYDVIMPGYLEARYWWGAFFSSSISQSQYNVFSLLQLSNSTLPPILNGIEVYWLMSMKNNLLTSADDGKKSFLLIVEMFFFPFIVFDEK